jgi:membrane fusion protein, multidrug efflux system
MATASLLSEFRRILGLSCGLLFVLLVSQSMGKGLPVIVAEARLDHFVDRLEALGTLRAQETVDLTATVTDTITAIHFEDGQRVEAGAILVEMTSDEEHALLEEERSTLEEAKKQFERVRPLVERGAAAATLLDQRRREYETARARLRAIESRLQSRLIRAPFAGVVGLRNISVGALIRPGDLITTLDDDSVMKLDFTVPDIYLATLKTGLPVTAKAPAFGDRTFKGEVSSISSRIDPTTRAIVVRAILPNPEHLLAPGLLMGVELSKNPRDAVVVPEQALIPHGQINRVFVVDPAGVPLLAERREVTIGGRRPGEVEIRAGLRAGEFVVVHGTLRVRPGQEVEIVAVDPGGQNLQQLLEKGKGGPGQ